jgi:exopolysaccharide biosynthesis polyprenyl glycosylphosphotransferase
MKKSEIFFGLLKIPTDFVAAILGFLAAYELRLLTEPIPGLAKPIDYSVLPTSIEYFNFSTATAAALVGVFALGKMYSMKSTVRFSKEIRKALILGTVWVMLIITYFFFTRTFPFSRLGMIYSWAIALLFVILGRAIIKFLQRMALKMKIGRRRVLFIGNNEITRDLIEKLSKNPSYRILGVIANSKDPVGKYRILGNISQLEYIAKRRKVEEIIQTHSDLSDTRAKDTLIFCNEHHIEYSFVPDLMEVQRTNIELQTIGAIPLITLRKTPLDGWGKVAKRIMDVIGAIAGLIILSPILLITAIAIKLGSKGPILFSRLDNGTPVKRVGQHGHLFPFYKFRSMHDKTNSLRYSDELASKNIREGSPLVKIKDDPRVTRVGRLIRKCSIDELPQLWNVLVGNMSLVGPRPHLPEEVAKYKGHHKFVLTIKPGITGLPQTSGRSDLDFETETRLDRFYIENWSIWFDIKLIFKTIGILLKGYKE